MIDLRDLEGLRYAPGGTDPATGVDCLWASRKALERVWRDFEPGELPITPEEIEAALAPAASHTAEWREVPRATRLGDLIHGHLADGHAYIAVLVDESGGVAITANPKRGVFLCPVRRLQGVRAVHRRFPKRP